MFRNRDSDIGQFRAYHQASLWFVCSPCRVILGVWIPKSRSRAHMPLTLASGVGYPVLGHHVVSSTCRTGRNSPLLPMSLGIGHQPWESSWMSECSKEEYRDSAIRTADCSLIVWSSGLVPLLSLRSRPTSQSTGVHNFSKRSSSESSRCFWVLASKIGVVCSFFLIILGSTSLLHMVPVVLRRPGNKTH